MSYIYLLAGENLKLADAELKGFLKSQGIEEEPVREGRIVLTENEPSKLKRLALVHEVSELIEEVEEVEEIEYRPDQSFSVRSVNARKDVEKKAGSVMETEETRVDLENPEENLRLYCWKDKILLGRVVDDIDRGLFEKRSNEKRVFSAPVSLDPVLARVLVNLSELGSGRRILDPFCGTGGILIEAGLCGIKPYGTDIQEEMVEGTEDNLESYGIINHEIEQGRIEEAGELFDQRFEGIVTDLPYGKASKTEGNPVEDFLEIAPELANGKIVFMSDREEIDGMKPEFEIYEHKNLTRYIYTI